MEYSQDCRTLKTCESFSMLQLVNGWGAACVCVCVCVCERERERERQRETETETETERQRETDRQTDKKGAVCDRRAKRTPVCVCVCVCVRAFVLACACIPSRQSSPISKKLVYNSV